jgi:lipid-binding SYLF domain-containing protein
MVRVAGIMRTVRLSFLVTALVATAALAAADADLIKEAQATIATFKKGDSKMVDKFFSTAVGYAVFPTIGKGGFIVGGAGGDGVLYVGGKPVGRAGMGQATIGFQLGGQTFSEIIFFENESTLSDFQKGNFALAAQASAVALSAGAAAAANYEHGVAIFTATKTGLMYEATVGGQKFSYHPFGTQPK